MAPKINHFFIGLLMTLILACTPTLPVHNTTHTTNYPNVLCANTVSSVPLNAPTHSLNTPISLPITTNYQPSHKYSTEPVKHSYRKKHHGKREVHHYIGNILHEALELHKNIITWDTFKIATMLFPFFVGTRMIDERLQNCFYDGEHHKNIEYLPKQCHDLAQWSISVPIVLLGTQAFFGSTQELRDTSQAFLLGLPFVFWTKTLLKKMQFEANMRPWHESFDCTKRSGGGFPSGHMAEATYTALLYGLSFGPRFAVPLGTVATFIGASFIACNRHYISQIVAGAGLGAVYGLAAYTLAKTKINEHLSLQFKYHQGGPALAASYTF